jgi:hypothetical protein
MMNDAQTRICNSFLQRIDATLELADANFLNSMVNKTKETLENNVSIWKSIQIDIFKTNLPGEIKNELSLHCDDVFRKYAKKIEEYMTP